MSESHEGYVNYYEILGLPEDAKPGEVRKVFRKRMKDLVAEIARAEITESRRAHYLLEMAKLNAALYLLRETDAREVYWRERAALISLELQWRDAAARAQAGEAVSPADLDDMRRQFDGRIRGFLSKYVEELMLEAGRDKECVADSHWDAAHERHAFRILRHYRHMLYQQILERLPYAEVTPPSIDWEERRRAVSAALGASPALST